MASTTLTQTIRPADASRARRAFSAVGRKLGGSPDKELFSTSWSECKYPLFFLLSMSLLGLSFYPALILIFIILLNRWKNDRYDFIFMLTFFFGGYAFVSKVQTYIATSDIAFIVSVILWILYRRPPLMNKLLLLMLIYIAGLFAIATQSLESMSIQFLTIRNYISILYIIVPVVVFGSMDFDITQFFRKAIIFTLIICVFYAIDCAIFSGNILVPNTHLHSGLTSKFYSPYWQPLSMHLLRKYPQGLYFMMLALYSIARVYRLRWWQWLIIAAGFFSTFTFTFISSAAIVYVFLIVKPSKILKYSLIFVVGCVSLYFIDGMLPTIKKELYDESTLRIKSSVDQFIELRNAVDDEDIARFASGRMAQALPKFELVAHENRQAFGLGFLHPDKTRINRYVIINQYYTDVSQNEEVATGIEIIAAQVYVTIGYVGLILHCLFFIFLYLLLRKLKYSTYVLSVIFANVIMGFGGFGSLIYPSGLLILSMSVGAVLLANPKEVWGRRISHVKTIFPQ